MKKTNHFILLIATICLLGVGLVHAQKNKLITSTSAGVIKLGMSAAEARRRAKPLKVSKGVNVFEGDMLSRVTEGRKLVMTFIEYTGKITRIDVVDSTYHTAKGVRVGMSLRDVEKKYGKLEKIEIDEQTDYEYAIFANSPAGLKFRVAVSGKGKRAGIYAKDAYETTKFNRGIFIKTIAVEPTY